MSKAFLSVLLGGFLLFASNLKADKLFDARVHYQVGGGLQRLAAGDFNDDGWYDLVTVDRRPLPGRMAPSRC